LGFETSVCVGWIKSFVVFDVDEYTVFFGFGEKFEVVSEGFDGRFGYEDMDLSFNGVESNRVVGGVWSEDRDC
jgi:hypothetical protein